VQYGEEHRTLQREAVLAFARELRDHTPAAGLLPQPLEHQRRSDPTHGDLERRIVVGRAQHHGLGRKARARAHQPFQLAARLQLVETAERGDHLLAHLVAVAAALDDLQIGAPGRGLAAEVHDGGSACWCAHGIAIRSKNQIKSIENVALHFRANATSHKAKSMTYAASARAKCRRWVSVSMTLRVYGM
jgi:hypothetical protein